MNVSAFIIVAALLIGFVIGLAAGLVIGSPSEPEPGPIGDPVTQSRMQALAASLQVTQAAWQTERDMMTTTLRAMQKQVQA